MYGASGVLLGALGAHGLQSVLSERQLDAWDTAVLYQLLHGVLLIALSVWHAVAPDRLIRAAAVALGVGVLLFSGSIYLLCFDAPRWLGPVTPLGGVAMILAWVLLIVAALRFGRAP